MLVALAAVGFFAAAGAAFWYQDVRYSLPTPRPQALVQPPLGTELHLDEWLRPAGIGAKDKPVLLHFFNPDCPCSRFNLSHLRELRARFGDRVSFVAAVQPYEEGELNDEDRAELKRAMIRLDVDIDWFIDTGGRLAALAGVYSTPQAVLTDSRWRIVYRGNYNVSRYCTDPKTQFVRLALEKLVSEDSKPSLGVAGRASEPPAYGCELPSNLRASK